jgi:tripartite ATP-independent transporter DctM subunit
MIILLVSLAVFLLVGIPIAYSLGLSALLYFSIVHPELLLVLPQRIFAGLDSYAMIALPLFVLMGLLMNKGGLTNRLIDFSMIFVGRLRGGLGLVNVLASMIFGGISGSSVSDTASIGAVLIPEMERKGYRRDFASGITVASSTMGMIIPPSIPMVIYAFVAEESVGKLFLGGAIPGIMIGFFMMSITVGISIWKKYPVEDMRLTPREVFNRLKRGFPAVLMPFFVVGAVVTGITTATEAAGIGVLYAFIVGFFIYRGIKLKVIPKLLRDCVMISATVMIIIAFSKLYTWILAIEHIPEMVTNFLVGLDVPLFLILLFLDFIILAIGTFVDVSPSILLLTPVFLPAMTALGMSPIQFGAILISGLAVGLVTPPVGMCLNVAASISKLEIGTIFRAAIPFLVANVLTLVLVTLIPPISLWLPTMLIK